MQRVSTFIRDGSRGFFGTQYTAIAIFAVVTGLGLFGLFAMRQPVREHLQSAENSSTHLCKHTSTQYPRCIFVVLLYRLLRCDWVRIRIRLRQTRYINTLADPVQVGALQNLSSLNVATATVFSFLLGSTCVCSALPAYLFLSVYIRV